VISSDLIHNHPEDENIERQALSNGVKRKALDNLTHKPAKLLRQELRQNGFLDQIFTYDVDRARKNLWQARRSVFLSQKLNLKRIILYPGLISLCCSR
jgi:hypothetical protein